MNRRTSLRILPFCIFLLSGTANAYQVRVTASGAMASFNDPSGLLPFANPGVGAEFSVSALYETATADANTNPSSGTYQFAILDFQFSIDGTPVATFSNNWIQINHVHTSTTNFETWSLVFSDQAPPPPNPTTLTKNVGVSLVSFGAEPNPFLVNDTLGMPPSFNLASSRTIAWSVSDYSRLPPTSMASAVAPISTFETSVVPIPTALPLFAGALFLIGRIARTRACLASHFQDKDT